MHQIPDNCVALMVTSPPYNCGKDYDLELDLDVFMAMLELLITETFRVLEPGGRVAINVANLGRKPYIPLNHHRWANSTGNGAGCGFLASWGLLHTSPSRPDRYGRNRSHPRLGRGWLRKPRGAMAAATAAPPLGKAARQLSDAARDELDLPLPFGDD